MKVPPQGLYHFFLENSPWVLEENFIRITKVLKKNIQKKFPSIFPLFLLGFPLEVFWILQKFLRKFFSEFFKKISVNSSGSSGSCARSSPGNSSKSSTGFFPKVFARIVLKIHPEEDMRIVPGVLLEILQSAAVAVLSEIARKYMEVYTRSFQQFLRKFFLDFLLEFILLGPLGLFPFEFFWSFSEIFQEVPSYR